MSKTACTARSYRPMSTAFVSTTTGGYNIAYEWSTATPPPPTFDDQCTSAPGPRARPCPREMASNKQRLRPGDHDAKPASAGLSEVTTSSLCRDTHTHTQRARGDQYDATRSTVLAPSKRPYDVRRRAAPGPRNRHKRRPRHPGARNPPPARVPHRLRRRIR